ncbi:MAG TPA: DUF2844 domain-containing protein [Paraburkholderia sp.]|jgi:hypothetical protein
MIATRSFGRRLATLAAPPCAVLFLAGAVLPSTARAGLGGAPMATPSGASVTQAMPSGTSVTQATPSVSSASAPANIVPYSIRETTLASRTVVREYLTGDGTVFGAAWSGPRMPDLAALLGDYFAQYVSSVAAYRQTGKVRRQAMLAQDTLVVHSGGHMGAFSGVAWLPQALPAGFVASDIQ